MASAITAMATFVFDLNVNEMIPATKAAGAYSLFIAVEITPRVAPLDSALTTLSSVLEVHRVPLFLVTRSSHSV